MSKLHYNATTPTVVDGTTVEMQSDASGNLKTSTGGNVASGATDSGNPVKVGGVYNTTRPALTNGQRGDLQLDARANAAVVLFGEGATTSVSVGVANADNVNLASSGLLRSQNLASLYNSSTWDRQRNNTDLTILASAARTATASSADITNYNGRGAHIVINVTAVTSTPSVVFTVEGKDALSSAYYTILTSAAITGTGTTALTVYPGATAAANVAVSQILPRTWRVTATHGDADSITFSVGASVVL